MGLTSEESLAPWVTAAWCSAQASTKLVGLDALQLAVGPAVQVITAVTPAEVQPCFDALEQQQAMGRVAVVLVPYESAPAFDPHLQIHTKTPTERVWFQALLFEPHQVLGWGAYCNMLQSRGLDTATPQALPLQQPWLEAMGGPWFDQTFKQVKAHIEAGDFYQINLTTRLNTQAQLPAPHTLACNQQLFAYFLALFVSQPARYSCFVHHHQHAVLCLSPELFFEWQPQSGRVVTQPMKGTRKPAAYSRANQALPDSSKDRAENLMIVDLLRNDLAKVCKPRTVQVDSLFDVLQLPSVEQMTSTVSGLTTPEVRLWDLFAALFPCGSVTGAPKVQAMKRIAELEGAPRGLYCGALGVWQPGQVVRFAVPIRTVEVNWKESDTPNAALRYGVGSGLTWYSDARSEQREWWQKTVFLRQAAPDFHVLETVRLHHGEWVNQAAHINRMKQAAQHFGFVWDVQVIHHILADTARQASGPGPWRGRWLLSASGALKVELFALEPNPAHLQLVLADRPMQADWQFVQFKTTFRPHYDSFSSLLQQHPECADVLLYNAQGLLSETCRFNVVLELDGRLLTPATHDTIPGNLLPGVLRGELLSNNTISQAEIDCIDLKQASRMWVINSLRGWIPVSRVLSPAGETLFGDKP